MKTLSLLMAFLCLGLSMALPQKLSTDKIPAAVTSSFTLQFLKAEKAKWEMERSDYEVNFKIGKIEWSAVYDSTGVLMETEETVSGSTLPKSVKESLKKEFPGYKIEQAEKLTKTNETAIYEIELEKKEQTVEIRIASDGKILSHETEEKGKEKENEKK